MNRFDPWGLQDQGTETGTDLDSPFYVPRHLWHNVNGAFAGVYGSLDGMARGTATFVWNGGLPRLGHDLMQGRFITKIPSAVAAAYAQNRAARAEWIRYSIRQGDFAKAQYYSNYYDYKLATDVGITLFGFVGF